MVLHGAEPGPSIQVREVERLGELPGVHRGRADVPDLAGLHGIMERLQRLLNWRAVVPPVDLVQVDVVGLQSAQARVQLREDRLTGQPPAGSARGPSA